MLGCKCLILTREHCRGPDYLLVSVLCRIGSRLKVRPLGSVSYPCSCDMRSFHILGVQAVMLVKYVGLTSPCP